jgi:transposase
MRRHAFAGKERTMFPAVLNCCAGIDVSKDKVDVCVLFGPADEEPSRQVRQYRTFNSELEYLRQWLQALGCTHAVVESTGSYWKPVFNILEGTVKVILANPGDVKNRKGHKTDREDCIFLAKLLRHGLVRASFIPPAAIRDLRDLTRLRKQYVGEATRTRNRVQKVLEDANVKLGSALSDVFGVSGQGILAALIEDELRVEEIPGYLRGRARQRAGEVTQAVTGHRLGEHHRFLLRQLLDQARFVEQSIQRLDEEIRRRIEEHGLTAAWELLQTIPGLRADSASVVLSECGADMSVFPTAGHLSSWAGLCPGNYQSGGKSLRASVNRGNRWLRATLTQSAWAASMKHGCHLRDRYWRLAAGGRKRALIAIAHALVVLIYQVLRTGKPYREQDSSPMEANRKSRLIRHHIRCLGRLGIAVSSSRAKASPRPRRKCETNLVPESDTPGT